MSITNEDIIKISHLARLQIEEKDIPRYTKDLANILDLVAQMQQVNTSNIEPLAHPLDVTQRLRPDLITENVPEILERFQKIASKTALNLYLVPKVIES